MKLLKVIFIVFAALLSQQVAAERIKDITSIQGVRENQLIGYGLVVGLDGTGEKTRYTEQTFRTMLARFGINVPQGSQLKLKNTAAVAVHASLPAFAKVGQTIDITVSSLGEAKSLRGGTLLMTPLRGTDGKTYAIAQGNLIVGGFGAQGADGSRISVNHQTVGRVPNGATVEQTVASNFLTNDYLVFNLNKPDFTTAVRLAKAINDLVGSQTAKPIDQTSIQVNAPRDPAQRINYLSVIENITVAPAESIGRIVVNSRTGTIVIGKHVNLKEAAIAHGNLIVKIKESQDISQPAPLSLQGTTVAAQDSQVELEREDSRMFHFKPGATLQQLVEAVNAVGAAPGDVMAILEALKQAGAISGELVVI
ncbi:flagellar basal body P-ring protein FlgI [Aliikangiella marina]|uniref:Flagellar P-ring protein n=1 Tax=Aliikangiella marina TaxID=1712262 RepID=A0A545TDL6_9GAMM|nr:flagellar basal body P-ring protein FlgI [Aliikangiella marina]TQV75309.1 flagellar basal body P-ring protein FlgI [Aliikangiella marina]